MELAALVQDQGLTHLHAHFGSAATTVARLASLLTGVPYTFTAHAKDIFHEEADPVDLGRKLADAVACVTVSDFNLAHLRAAYPAAASGIVRICNGLDLRRFPYTDPVDRPPLVVSVGRTGDLVHRITGDVGRLQEVAVTAALPLAGNVITFVGMAGVMAWLDWRLALLALLALPLFLLTSIRLTKRITSVSRAQRRQEGELASAAAESLGAIKVVQAYSLEPTLERRDLPALAALADRSRRRALLRRLLWPPGCAWPACTPSGPAKSAAAAGLLAPGCAG